MFVHLQNKYSQNYYLFNIFIAYLPDHIANIGLVTLPAKLN